MADFIGCHVVAIPYPGRGHINPMMNLCKLIALRRPSDFLITFVVTEEWLGFIEYEPKPTNIRFATIPNVIPSEVDRAVDFPKFFKAIQTEMEYPVEQLLHRMEVPVNVIIFDTFLIWVLNIGNRMNIPVASFFTCSATVFSICYNYDLLVQNGHAGDNFSEEKVMEEVDYLPGVPPIRVVDLPKGFDGKDKLLAPIVLQAVSMAPKAQFLLFVSVYELELPVIDIFKKVLSRPVYAVGPTIPYYNLNDKRDDQNSTPDYIKWLDRQPEASVLHISQGSFLSVSTDQLNEIIAGVHDSGIHFMWIARGETACFKHENGLVLPWCDQLRVLCHSSIGAFWSHCGWSSTIESAFSVVPMLTFPIVADQLPNSKMIVEDWKMGRRVKTEDGNLVTREEIVKLVTSFMDQESKEGKEMREMAREVKKICRKATTEEGSGQIEIGLFISDILQSCNN